jgi:hypothetical protein
MHRFRQLSTVLMLTLLCVATAAAACHSAEPAKVRDRLWVWAHHEGTYNGHWGLPGKSRITPIEGAAYLGVPNVIFIGTFGAEFPLEQYAIPFRGMDRVMWSMFGGVDQTSEVGRQRAEERQRVLELAQGMPNFTGVFVDDFFVSRPAAKGQKPTLTGVMSLEDLRRLRQRLVFGPRRVDLAMTLYTHQFDPAIVPYMQLFDVVSVWTWKAADLPQLEPNMQRFWQMSPKSRTLLGLYMWDFGIHKPMPIAAMQHQCDLGLKWLHEGRVEGLILLATNICDLNLETVEWTRAWVARVGNEPLKHAGR